MIKDAPCGALSENTHTNTHAWGEKCRIEDIKSGYKIICGGKERDMHTRFVSVYTNVNKGGKRGCLFTPQYHSVSSSASGLFYPDTARKNVSSADCFCMRGHFDDAHTNSMPTSIWFY